MYSLLRYSRVTHVVVLALVFVCGCGATQTQPVSGIVTMDEKPLAGVSVIFAPAEGGRRNSVGKTDETGAYSLVYTVRDKGAIAGKYKVLISKRKTVKEREVETLPAKYNRKSILEANVTASGDNKFNFNLESE